MQHPSGCRIPFMAARTCCCLNGPVIFKPVRVRRSSVL
ncbi:hypothetical protein Y88_0183 [Novosphingobium nitrogenifigens DSM 19370]|uniref:Uncharacterized protein n=1 Tax=Novosphingobium nitrogenifigens DSM 19370 TaxID=983920 RepID=F1ZAT2_9SPHN|nr:hypothetical protein Y88_0183 [Novosphingobium nitrogenifigens DSM 19370]